MGARTSCEGTAVPFLDRWCCSYDNAGVMMICLVPVAVVSALVFSVAQDNANHNDELGTSFDSYKKVVSAWTRHARVEFEELPIPTVAIVDGGGFASNFTSPLALDRDGERAMAVASPQILAASERVVLQTEAPVGHPAGTPAERFQLDIGGAKVSVQARRCQPRKDCSEVENNYKCENGDSPTYAWHSILVGLELVSDGAGGVDDPSEYMCSHLWGPEVKVASAAACETWEAQLETSQPFTLVVRSANDPYVAAGELTFCSFDFTPYENTYQYGALIALILAVVLMLVTASVFLIRAWQFNRCPCCWGRRPSYATETTREAGPIVVPIDACEVGAARLRGEE